MQDKELSIYQKTKKILEIDQNQKSAMIYEVVKSDIFNVLQSYFCIEKDKIDFEIDFDGDKFAIKLFAYAGKVKSLNYLQ